MNWPQGIKSKRMVSVFQLLDNRKEVKAGKKIKIIDQSGNLKSYGEVTIKCIRGCESSATVFICGCILEFNTKVTRSPHMSKNIWGIYTYVESWNVKKWPGQSAGLVVLANSLWEVGLKKQRSCFVLNAKGLHPALEMSWRSSKRECFRSKICILQTAI